MMTSHAPQQAAVWSTTDATRRVDVETQLDKSISVEQIYDHAAALIDREGVAALTLGRLAADLQIPARVLHRRIPDQNRMIRQVARRHFTQLKPPFRKFSSWEATALKWCLELHAALTAHPQRSALMNDEDRVALRRSANQLLDYMLAEGFTLDEARACCRALLDVTINDAYFISRSKPTDEHHPPTDAMLQRDFPSTVKMVLAGVALHRHHSQSSTTPPAGRTSRPRQTTGAGARANPPDEGSLAWDLMDSAMPLMNDEMRMALCAKVGAGEFQAAIFDILTFFARYNRAIPTDLAASVRRWIGGYQGSDYEAALLRLIRRIPPAAANA